MPKMSATTLGIMTLGITTLSATIESDTNGAQCSDAKSCVVHAERRVFYCYAECRFDECHGAQKSDIGLQYESKDYTITPFTHIKPRYNKLSCLSIQHQYFFVAVLLQINCNGYSCVEGVWHFLSFNLSF